MKLLALSLLTLGLALAAPATFAAADEAPPEPCARPYVSAYACFWGSTGVQDLTVCGEEIGSFCIPL